MRLLRTVGNGPTWSQIGPRLGSIRETDLLHPQIPIDQIVASTRITSTPLTDVQPLWPIRSSDGPYARCAARPRPRKPQVPTHTHSRHTSVPADRGKRCPLCPGQPWRSLFSLLNDCAGVFAPRSKDDIVGNQTVVLLRDSTMATVTVIVTLLGSVVEAVEVDEDDLPCGCCRVEFAREAGC